MKRIALLLVGALSSACYIPYYVPTPGSRLEPTGATVDLARAARTREDVLLALGEPDWVMKEGRLFLYTWQAQWGWWLFATPGGGGGGPLYGARQFVVVEFDVNGAVVRSERAEDFFGRLGPEVETW